MHLRAHNDAFAQRRTVQEVANETAYGCRYILGIELGQKLIFQLHAIGEWQPPNMIQSKCFEIKDGTFDKRGAHINSNERHRNSQRGIKVATRAAADLDVCQNRRLGGPCPAAGAVT